MFEFLIILTGIIAVYLVPGVSLVLFYRKGIAWKDSIVRSKLSPEELEKETVSLRSLYFIGIVLWPLADWVDINYYQGWWESNQQSKEQRDEQDDDSDVSAGGPEKV